MNLNRIAELAPHAIEIQKYWFDGPEIRIGALIFESQWNKCVCKPANQRTGTCINEQRSNRIMLEDLPHETSKHECTEITYHETVDGEKKNSCKEASEGGSGVVEK